MIKILTLFAVVVTGFSIMTLKSPNFNDLQTKVHSNEAVIDLEMPNVEQLASSEEAVKLRTADKTIVLEAKNTLVLKGPVTNSSVAKLQAQANKMSFKLKKKDKIYLVLDTPGGSVFAGMDLIDYLRALPQKIETVTLFAASMGFQIAQNMDTRYITPAGTLMSHRARGGLQGQFDGELESRYKMIKRKLDYLDAIASKRMGISVKQYKKLIKDEYWVSGFDAEGGKAADEIVNVRCGKSLSGTKTEKVRTFLGPVKVIFSKCPVIRGILNVDFTKILEINRKKVKDAIFKGYEQKRKYVEDFILTDEHYKMFP